jgi:hypothetical protein
MHQKIIMNGIQIDVEISNLIQTLWDNKIETIQCCKGGDIVEKKTRFSHLDNNKIIENAHIIFFKKDIDLIKSFLPEDTEYIVGDLSKTGFFEGWLGVFDGAWASFINK